MRWPTDSRCRRDDTGRDDTGRDDTGSDDTGSDDTGSAIAEFAMVSVLLMFLLFAVLQVAAVLYVRAIVSAAASDGARYAANAGVDAVAGGPRATSLISKAIGPRTAARISCDGSQVPDAVSGLQTAKVVCSGQITSIFLPLGALVTVSATGQSLKEQP
jgi:Flp pilus assembly protein TadG